MAYTLPTQSPASRLLEVLGPVEKWYDYEELGDIGSPARQTMGDLLAPHERKKEASVLGPWEAIHAFWFSGMSCDGCSVSVTGATTPSLERLLLGADPGLPRIILHHPVLSLEAGAHYFESAQKALRGELEAPYVVILEGSISDELKALEQGGQWAGNGEMPWGPDGEERTVTAEEFVARLAPGAAAAIAIGTCATWGGIPSAEGNPTGAMSLMDFLGKDYRSAFGLPVINVPGCAPVGDNFTETVAAILYFLQGIGPLPEFDELGRPRWLFEETVHHHCVRGAYYEEGLFAKTFGDKECLVEIGCWGPVVQCNITSRGAINHVGGCMNVGGACIGCHMPGFPDKFTPFYHTSPGSLVSSTTSKAVGRVIRPLRRYTQQHLNRETRWDVHRDEAQSGFNVAGRPPSRISEAGHELYDMRRRKNDHSKKKVNLWGRRREWTLDHEPESEPRLEEHLHSIEGSGELKKAKEHARGHE
jgi:hydrogenase small subunit